MLYHDSIWFPDLCLHGSLNQLEAWEKPMKACLLVLAPLQRRSTIMIMEQLEDCILRHLCWHDPPWPSPPQANPSHMDCIYMALVFLQGDLILALVLQVGSASLRQRLANEKQRVQARGQASNGPAAGQNHDSMCSANMRHSYLQLCMTLNEPSHQAWWL